MSESYVKNKILDIQKQLSCSDVLSVKAAMESAKSNQMPVLNYDEELVFWQLYYKKKIQYRANFLGIYIFSTIVSSLIVSDIVVWSDWVIKNIRIAIAIWLFIPVFLCFIRWIGNTYIFPSAKSKANKILEAYFSDVLAEDKKNKKDSE